MHLISLDIHGFKSFPERTLLEFHEGVTAIVGPNGSGKSNVTDAIRWVLGEQSVKTLRGDSMQDIIFSGTSTRRSMSFAEVTMNIDNSDRLLNIDFAEVAITRRLYRSGESEYKINQQQVRLKDINNLFMDTGLGKDSYSIIGQGKVDEILSSKSEDRRRVFEEAAGIQKYKTRKAEAVRKLEHTEANLTRVNDILMELEGQLEPLKKQSETAKAYLNIHGQMRQEDIRLIAYRIEEANERDVKLKADIKALSVDLEQSIKKEEALDIDQLNGKEKLAKISEDLSAFRSLRDQLLTDEAQTKQEESRLSERYEQLQRRLGEHGDSEEQIESRIKALKLDLDDREDKIKALSERLSLAKHLFDELRATLHQHQADVREAEDKIGELKRGQEEESRERRHLESLKLRQESEAALLVEQEALFNQEDLELKEQIEAVQLRLLACQEGLDQLKQEDAKLAENSRVIQEKITKDRNVLKELEILSERHQQDIRNKTYRLDTLRELERNMEGYAEATRNILRRASSDQFLRSAVRGALGSLLTVDKELELAIEIALGASVQNIVVDTSKHAASIIDLLKRERLGRATFLPIDTIRARSLNERELNDLEQFSHRGYIGIAADLISYPQEIDAIVKNILGRIVVVRTLDLAMPIARHFGQSFRIVTLEGDVLNPGGSMTGGYTRKKSSGLLGRNREIQSLEAALNLHYKEAKETDNKVLEQEQNVRASMRQVEQIQTKGMEMAQLKSREEAKLAALEEQRQGLLNRSILKQKQIDELKLRAKRSKEDRSEIEIRLAELEGNENAYTEQMDALEFSLGELGNKQNEARDKVAAQDLDIARLEASLNSAKDLAMHIRREYESRDQEAKDAKEVRRTAEEELVLLEEQLNKVRHTARSFIEKIQNMDKQIEEAETLRSEKEAEVTRLYTAIRTQAETSISLKAQVERQSDRIEKLELDLDTWRSKLWEDYELTEAMLDKEALHLDDPEYKADVAQKLIASLRTKIRNLGPVNIEAIENYEQVSERYTFLSAQRDDIEAAREQLNKVIDELVLAMRDQFQSNFDLIRIYFKETFQELFGGGEADISLEDGLDILEGSIEIKASPPGKKLQNMLLLSGGERSLTAIALLFAILKLRPTPFCVLDEIEAALDDVNTLRFTDYIRSYKEKSQFIMVTHRKGTMESADMIYGVTMQEKGVSKVLSMVLSDAT